MSDNVPINLTVTCGHCGTPLRTSDDTQDLDIVRCDSCDRPIGTYAEIVQAAREQAVNLVNEKLKDTLKPALKRNKITPIQ
jgi:hypothetical protein